MSRAPAIRNEHEAKIREALEIQMAVHNDLANEHLAREDAENRASLAQHYADHYEREASSLRAERDHYMAQVARLQEQLRAVGRYFAQQAAIAQEWATEADLAPFTRGNQMTVRPVDDGAPSPAFLHERREGLQ